MKHTHEIENMPTTGTGHAVCACGATLRFENGKPIGEWHTCRLCTHPYGLPTGAK